MTMMKIEVIPDTSTPAGGHAIIRLRGVALLPPGATFRIDPIDDSLDNGDPASWPRGDLKPIETRQTPDGVEMRVGPDVVDATLLEPGTPVTISVPDGHVSAELVWPDIPLSASGSPTAVVMTPSQMAAEIASAERAKLEAAKVAEASKAADAMRALAIPPAANDTVAASSGETSNQVSVIEQHRMLAAARALEAALAVEPAATAPAALDLADSQARAPQPPAMAASSDRGRDPDRSLSSLAKPPADRADQLAHMADRDSSLPAIILKRATEQAATPLAPTELRHDTIEGHVAPPASTSRLMPFLAGAGAAGLAAAVILAVLAVRNGSLPFPTAGGVAPAGASLSKTTLADAFLAGTQSPRGEIATDVDLPTALRLADYNLHGIDRPVDRAEAEFWLKKAMSLTASHSQLRWAMTQLGTLSAEPVAGPPDYDKARMLWEISAANGDPVATCFLGTLLEFGLGAPADRTKALEAFKRSKELGGCPNTDEAIARLSK